MPDEPVNYVKEAFLHPWNLAFLLVAMTVVFFTIGLSPLPELVLLLTLALEALYLGTMPRQERFRRAVRARRLAEDQKPLSERDTFQQLTRASQRRYIRFRQLESAIKDNYRRLSYASQGLLTAHLQKIDELLRSYLNLLLQKERYERFAEQASEEEVVRAMQALRDEMQHDPPRVAQIKQKRLDILQRRLDRFKKVHENLALIVAQIETIEDVTRYIHEQSLTMRNPEEVTLQLDSLLAEVEETQTSVAETEEVLARPTDLLGSLDAFPDPEPSRARPDRLRT